ncbi:NUDIX domain-containing protein [Deinococcus radiopugnans]|uniref:NUDIX domain-containing protein n=1 Tax=Deinococcus radiopugnans ATCC 19172 TaxID=585398 RepID=A0A5C4XXT7_9DEIO|nr:NUDIX domain-containing protein [Deinococcus radiopugnans]TNM67998.1 NUDIX domain-containing protein [Deinococcus radiopugnans ATCC 19172]
MGAGVAVLKAGEVLLIRRGDNGLWDIPGGGRRWWETPARAARRELAEETGLSVGALHPLGVFQHRHTYLDGNTVDWETHVFTSEYAGGEARAGDDAHETRWWPQDALPQAVSDATARYFAALRQPPPLRQHAGA